MKTLRLPIKKKWFDMIRSGKKKEEYRDIKPHYVSRFINYKQETEWEVVDEFITDLKWPYNRHLGPDELMNYFNVEFKKLDNILFINGYRKESPRFYIDLKGIEIDNGKEIWGAEPGKFYFVLKLGELI